MSAELKHAEVICHMAKHGFESVEYKPNDDTKWFTGYDERTPLSHKHYEWRIKPATITYTVTVPEPMRVMPKIGDVYWTSNTIEVYRDTWDALPTDARLFEMGNIWDAEAKAQQAFDALFGPLRAVK